MLRSLVSENVSRIPLVHVFRLSMRNYARQNKIPVLLVFTKDDKAGHKSSRAVEPFLAEGQVFQICNYFKMLYVEETRRNCYLQNTTCWRA